ncbi:hypothetical protein NA78x_001760 [Anatilimnocola sp. NA78]|uniref:hypothetical protein n=1 Tax=Anatilimnocola sp. NA78 TaxID=3415683 RepID=UPI003CE5982F
MRYIIKALTWYIVDSPSDESVTNEIEAAAPVSGLRYFVREFADATWEWGYEDDQEHGSTEECSSEDDGKDEANEHNRRKMREGLTEV